MNMKTISDRVAQRMATLNIRAARIVEHTGASKATVSKWVSGNGNPSSEYIMPLAEILRCTPEWLLTGMGVAPDDGIANTAPGPDLVEQVPLLGYTTAGAFQHVRELEEWEIEKWYPTIKKLNGKGFALRVEGDSMTSPTGRSYPSGSIAIFNAGNKSPNNGDLVLAKLAGSDEITFKKYVCDAGQCWLAPLNPAFPPLHVDFRVLAVFEHALVF